MRDICSHLKKLEPEAAYKVQVSAWHRKPGGITGRQSDPHSKEEESEGPFSAKLHFTTQTNRKYTHFEAKSSYYIDYDYHYLLLFSFTISTLSFKKTIC